MGLAFGCGQCLPCRINRRRLWVHRLMLEALVNPSASFVTLTYDDEHLPDGYTLEPRDMQLFLKRFRKAVSPIAVRFFGVGEYGDLSGRPHYHLALFFSGEGASLFTPGTDALENQVKTSWGIGLTHCGDLTFDSAAYICGYVTKKLTGKGDARLAETQHPEFARMSNRPGIGAHAIRTIAEALQIRHGWNEISKSGDVPQVLRHGAKSLPLGRYLRRKLREEMNFEDTRTPPEGLYELSLEMSALLKDHLLNTPNGTLKSALQEANRQKIRNIETRHKIFSARKSL